MQISFELISSTFTRRLLISLSIALCHLQDIQLLEYPIPPPLSVTFFCVQWISGTESRIIDPLVTQRPGKILELGDFLTYYKFQWDDKYVTII